MERGGGSFDYPQWATANVRCGGDLAGPLFNILGKDHSLADWEILRMAGQKYLLHLHEGVKMIQENVLYIKPDVVGGDGTTLLNVVIVARKASKIERFKKVTATLKNRRVR